MRVRLFILGGAVPPAVPQEGESVLGRLPAEAPPGDGLYGPMPDGADVPQPLAEGVPENGSADPTIIPVGELYKFSDISAGTAGDGIAYESDGYYATLDRAGELYRVRSDGYKWDLASRRSQ